MIDDKKYASFVISVARDNRDRVTTLVVGNKSKGQMKILNAFGGDSAQYMYNLLCGRTKLDLI